MKELTTIFDDISYEITNRIQAKQLGKNALNTQARAFAQYHINREENYEQYFGGTEEENEIEQGLCFLVQLTQSLINFSPEKYKGLLNIYDYLDPNMTDGIDQEKAVEVIRRVMQ